MNTLKVQFRTFSKLLTASLMLLFVVSSCVDQEFDAPPGGGEESIAPNTTIAELRAMHTPGEYEEILENIIIRGVVISSDREGNFFRQLVLQDETGGIEIRIEATDLDNIYPPGRQVSVMCNKLWLGDFAGLYQLGASVTGTGNDRELERLPEPLLSDVLKPGTFGNDVVPAEKTIGDLTFADMSTLVKLTDVQFVGNELGLTFSELDRSTNRNIEDCSFDNLIVRTSSFSTFAQDPLPQGSGSITGVLGVFVNDFQVVIRDLDDVDMSGDRCGTGGTTLNIGDLRSQFAGGNAQVPEGSIEGIVISDYETGNITGRNLHIQDATGGLILRLGSNHSYALGTNIRVAVGGLQMSEFSGVLQIEAPDQSVLPLGPGTLPTPRVATVAELLANLEAWESTLVKVEKATISGNSVFGGSLNVSDGTGSIAMFTRTQASFAGSPVPSGEVDITAILSQFDDAQLVLRNSDDVKGEGGNGGGALNEGFDSQSSNQDIALNGWVNTAIKGTRAWQGKEFDGNRYAQATAFNDDNPDMETWLITPVINVAETPTLTFETAQAFHNHNGLTVWASTDFDGTNVESATWMEVDAELASSTSPDHGWIASGNVDLSTFTSGEIRVGFKYVGSGPGGQTTSFRIDNVKAE